MQPHPLLRRLFAALEERRLGWLLLRIPSNFEKPTGDLDLLVAPEDVDRLMEAAADLGFVALPGWERPPNLILMCYDKPSDAWIVLDVTTVVSFQSPRAWELRDGARSVLARRQVRDGVATPAGDDAFWLLLAHCVLDKGAIAHHYRGPIRELAPGSSRSSIGWALLSAAGDSHEPVAFERAAADGAWEDLEAMGTRLASDLRLHRSRMQQSRAAAAAFLHAARKPLLLRRRMGVSVALLGPNGVGKSTVAAGLKDGFPLGSNVMYMGLWKGSGGTPARRAGEILLRPLRIWGRYSIALYHRARGRLVIFDRYVYEARLPAKPPLLAAKRPYFWLLGHAVPRPDATVVLDVAGHVAYGRKQENPPEELEQERRIYASLAGEPSVELVDAARDPASVRADVSAIVWRKLCARWQGGSRACEPARD